MAFKSILTLKAFKTKFRTMMKISVSTDISIIGFYGYIGYIGDISVDIFT